MSNKKLMKKVLVFSLSATMALAIGSSAYADTQALPNGTIVNQNGTKYLTDLKGEKYSGWFKDSKEDWYYFNEADKAMKTDWHHDGKDGYWYYLNLSDGKMATGWQVIDGKEYFFQPVRNPGNYKFNTEQEKWLYSLNSKVPYGAMYVNTTTPDGAKVDSTGAKVVTTGNNNQGTTTKAVKNGWVLQNGKWYYYESDVIDKDKWLNLSGKWYYVAEDGVMVSNGWKEIGGKSYYFGSDGAMYVNTTTPDGKSVVPDGTERQKTISTLSEKQKRVIKTVLGREILRNDGSFKVSSFDKQYVRDTMYFYTYGYYSDMAYNPNLGIIDRIFDDDVDYPDYYYNRKTVNKALKDIYGIDPNFKNGETDQFGSTKISDDKIMYISGGDGEAVGETNISNYTFEDGFLIVKGDYWCNANIGILDKWKYCAKFKVNSDSFFGFTLVSCDVTK